MPIVELAMNDGESICLGCMQRAAVNGVCPECGFDEAEAAKNRYPAALRLCTLLHGQYLIGRILGQGGFGITYLGWDVNLGLRVAIKEYLPAGFATREPDRLTVSPHTGEGGDYYHLGLDKFLDEGRALARFQYHHGIVSVVNFFRENNTGYLVMEYVDGVTLKQHLDEHGGAITFDESMRLLLPVMEALAEVHRADMLHRDVSPDNISIGRGGHVKILDFGSARVAIREESRTLSVVLKPGYAPLEQYRSRGVQGPWTDVYALCATVYRAITGELPPQSLDRLEQDQLAAPSTLGVAIPPAAEATLLAGLAVRASDRVQSMDELHDRFLDAIAAQPTRIEPLPRVEARPVARGAGLLPDWSPAATRRAAIAGAALAACAAGVLVARSAIRPSLPVIIAEAPTASATPVAELSTPAIPIPGTPLPVPTVAPAVPPAAEAPRTGAPVIIAEAPSGSSAMPAPTATAPATRAVSIDTIPQGARVVLDGTPLGETPLHDVEVPPQAAHLHLELAGYASVDRLLEEDDPDVRLKLKRLPARSPKRAAAPSENVEETESDGEGTGLFGLIGRGVRSAGRGISGAGQFIVNGFRPDDD